MSQICWVLPSVQFPHKYLYRKAHSIKNVFAVSYLAQFLGPITDKNIFGIWVFNKKNIYITLLYDAGQFYVKKNKMAAEYKSMKPFPVTA